MENKKILSGLYNRGLKKVNLLAEAKVRLGEARMDICKACDSFRKDSTCKECGCFMKTKVLVERAECPLKKW